MTQCSNCHEIHVVTDEWCRSMNPVLNAYWAMPKHKKDADPKWFANGTNTANAATEPERRSSGSAGTGTGRRPVTKQGDFHAPSEKATGYLDSLLSTLGRLSESGADAIRKMRNRMIEDGTFDARSCSHFIDQTKKEFDACGGWPALNRADNTAPAMPEVPSGHYALPGTGANEIVFYEVWHGTTNPEYVGVELETGPTSRRVPLSQIRGILDRIAADVQGAMLRYGQETGQCGHCGRRLTNDESRRAGIGPICRAKMEW
jgi:hypothetical protein